MKRLMGVTVVFAALLAFVGLLAFRSIKIRSAEHAIDESREQTAPSHSAKTPSRRDKYADEIAEWRHAFSAQRVGALAAGSKAQDIVLAARTIDTAARPVLDGPLQKLTSRGTAPYLIQFEGPVADAAKTELEKSGAVIRGYIPNHAFLVEVAPEVVPAVEAIPSVRWMGEYRPEDKVQPFLRYVAQRLAERAAEEPAGDVEWPKVEVSVRTLAPEDVKALTGLLRDLSAEVLHAQPGRRWGLVRARITPSEAVLAQLASRGEVQWVEEFLPRVMHNDFAVRSDHMNVTNVWYTHGLTGRRQVIGHADTGLDVGTLAGLHPDFTGRIRIAIARGRPGNWSDPDGHGTHTAGSVLGSGAGSAGQFRGVAFEAELVHQSVLDSGGGLGGLPADLYDLYLEAYTNSARIHSDSWGSSVYGQYTVDSQSSDEFMWDYPDMLLVFSAGNDGRDLNNNGVVDPDSIGAPATAKNMVTVGAAESDRAPGTGGYTGYSWGYAWGSKFGADPIKNDYISQSADGIRQGIAAFSSRGPTDDGRIKPDIVAPGTDVISARSRVSGAGTGWGTHPNTNYAFSGGTSMSTPLVAGAAALVRQFFMERQGMTNPSAALVKATLLNGARSLTPGQYGTNATREIPPPPRPNNVEGWGQADLARTLFPTAPVRITAGDTNRISTGITNVFTLFIGHTNMSRVTLAYSDYPASAGAGKKLVNDLDLRVTAPGGSNYFPNGFSGPDRTNNVEGIDFVPVVSGVYTVRVSGFNVPFGPQPYALVFSGGWEPVFAASRPNTTNTTDAIPVDAMISSLRGADTNTFRMYWNTNASVRFHTGSLVRVEGPVYRGFIPPQPEKTIVHYYFEAQVDGAVQRYPSNAPASLLSFRITPPVYLTVTGTPAEFAAPVPSYGIHAYAENTPAVATVAAFSEPVAGTRYASMGWMGSGSVPPTGAVPQVAFVMATNSRLDWQWSPQYALTLSGSVPGVLSATNWWFAGQTSAPVAAVATVNVSTSEYRFAHWLLDGARQPDPSSRAVNPLPGIVIATSRTAVAVYFPGDLDSDGNGLPDWWEYHYFGNTGIVAAADADGDLFSNKMEFLDDSDPRDAGSIPTPPEITHSLIPTPQPVPAPWHVAAAVTDSGRVASVSLICSRNGGVPSTTAFHSAGANLYTNAIPAPGVSGDAFSYTIVARDAAGLSTIIPHAFTVAYGIGVLAPTNFGTLWLRPGTVSNVVLHVENSGHADLLWSLQRTSTPTNDGWWTIQPTNGLLADGTATSVVVSLIAAGLTNGASRSGTLVFRSNDPTRPSNSVPLTLQAGLPPVIVPMAVQNTTNLVDPYAVAADLIPFAHVDTNRTKVFWNTTGVPGGFSTSPMSRVSGDRFRAFIPPLPLGTRIHYFYEAIGTNGLGARYPTNAPGMLLSFDVVGVVTLVVTGSPEEVGAVVPDYGVHLLGSGTLLSASSPLVVGPAGGSRWLNTGWVGSGSVAASGIAQSVEFVINTDSFLDWQWSFQHGLLQTSNVPGILSTTTWWNEGSLAESITAADSVVTAGTNHRFAQWNLDGLRQPGAAGLAVNPVAGIAMPTSRVAVAVYYPENQDSNTNGLPDWWEARYGDDIVGPEDDPDGDGYSNLLEYLDGTNPLDFDSFPVPPVIVHSPLTDPQSVPAPWMVSAVITDNMMVAQAELWWQRNGAAWQSVAMEAGIGTNEFVAEIPAPALPGDMLEYRIEATDGAGLSTTNGPHAFEVEYPVIGIAPANLELNWLAVGQMTQRTLTITNSGNAPLAWQIAAAPAGLEDDVEWGAGGWTHGGIGNLWRVSTNRSYSPTHAWYCGFFGEPGYDNGMNAWLLSPSIRVVQGARLEFRYWADVEIDEGFPPYAFDGGVVEISTDGTNFIQISPIGGYPYVAHGLYGSPFANGTPIFAGTGGWQRAEFDVAAYAGQDVQIRFRFGSDEAFAVGEGWYVDDILLRPASATGSWFEIGTTSGVIGAATATDVTITLDAAELSDGDRLAALLHVLSNDPAAPLNAVPLSLFVGEPVVIVHDPLQNTTNSVDDYIVTAVLEPQGLFDTNELVCAVLWNTNGPGHPFVTNVMTTGGEDVWNGVIPARPLGTEVYYFLRAEIGGVETRHPADAPTNLHRFAITTPVRLEIMGFPDTIGSPVPPYGVYTYAWGTVIHASVQDVTNAGVWFQCEALIGDGSVPPLLFTNSISFSLEADSFVLWWWARHYQFVESSSPEGIIDSTVWVSELVTTSTVLAATSHGLGSVDYRFTGWTLNGVRQSGVLGKAINPVVDIVMTSAQTAVAGYLPVSQDSDGDGLPDWWELFYFGTLDWGPNDDPDGDGYGNFAEYGDGTDPTDIASVPAPPAILHTPLTDPQTSIAPWLVSAVVTDNARLADTSVAGSAVRFNGVSDHAIKQAMKSFPTSAITVEFWMKSSDKVRRGTPFSYAVAGDFNDANEFTLYNYNTFLIYRGAVYTNTQVGATDGQWTHVAVTWRGSDGQTRLYRNGTLEFDGALSPGVPIRPEGILVLAQDQDSYGGGFSGDDAVEGLMDELRVWNVVRSGDEIRETMSNRLWGTEAGLVGYWRFDEGSGTIAYDMAAPANHFTLVGAKWTNSDAFVSADVRLGWARNGGDWQYTIMLPQTADQFMAYIPAPGINGDAFAYAISARDAGGLWATNGPHAFNVGHPDIELAPRDFSDIWMLPDTTTGRVLVVSNAGLGTLNWTLQTESQGLVDDVESGTNNWTHSGPSEQWHITTKRSFSPTRSWYCGDETAGTYLNNMDARLDTPPVALGTGARLSFRHWADLEMQSATIAWDGAVVEISTNSGESFTRITPVGGYPYSVNGGFGQPLPAGIGVFAGVGGWTQAVFDLSSYAGHEAIIRFRMGSDVVNDYLAEGWFIDDIVVTPTEGTNDWLLISATNGVVDSYSATNLTLTFDSAGMTSGARYAKSMIISANDPSEPAAQIPVVLSVGVQPVIVHTPFPNTAVTSGTYAIEAAITPAAFINTNELKVFWNTNGSPVAFSTALMVRVTGDVYRALLPAQPMGTRVHYYLSAMAGVGLVTTEPSDAPAILHVFEVAQTRNLLVTGTPLETGFPSPDYGSHALASGAVVQAFASPAEPVSGTRYAASGWLGSGSVPATGSTHNVTFALLEDSILDWQWSVQYELSQTSTVRGAVETSSWWFAGATGETVVAPWAWTLQSTNYVFAQWVVDGARQPDATNPAVNPAANIIMSAARSAAAVYLPAELDLDGDDLADWWEYRYFGSLTPWRNDDPDGDGFSNLMEYRDRTDPRDAGSFPVPPVIQHAPLPSPQTAGAPWQVTAVVTDNYMVANATLWWRRNSDAWQSSNMTSGVSNQYAAIIAGPATDGDVFNYRIEATDAAGLRATNGPHAFAVLWPVLTIITPTNMENILVVENTTSNVFLGLGNIGGGTLGWTAAVWRVGLWDDVESGAGEWSHDGAGDLWHISTNRAASPIHSWYGGSVATREYGNSMDSRLIGEPVLLGPSAQLVFKHFMDSELKDSQYAYDGGVVEISTNGGVTFAQITPVGGYPYRLAAGTSLPAETPCFAGTGGWQTVTFSLAAHAGKTARFRFRFVSDSSKTREGWYVDDVAVYPGTGDGAWLELQNNSGTLGPSVATLVTVSLSAVDLPGGTRWPAEIAVTSTDPLRPLQILPISMAILGVWTDLDGDGMPDLWEYGYGFDPLNPDDAALDWDGDDFSNLDEYIAGTDPKDDSSYFRMTDIKADSGRGVEFLSISSRVYSLFAASNFFDGVLWNIVTQAPGSNGIMTLVDTNAAARRYYRISVEPAP